MTSWGILYHKGSSGKLYQWQVWTDGPEILTRYGQVGGKMQVARKTAEAKNVGRSNATTPEQQAVIEAEAMHVYKLERKYFHTPKECKDTLPLPMLAHNFEKRKKNLVYPVWVQPKLDGVRCMARWRDGGVELLSRAGKLWDIPHLAEELAGVMPEDMVLDGEIYIHGKTFQDLSKLVKKKRPESLNLEYHVYDMPVVGDDAELVFNHRLAALEELDFHGAPHLKLVPTSPAENEEDVYKYQSAYLEKGYEGAIVRAASGVYKFGYRSADLLKVKKFLDREYEIVGYHSGVGKFETCVIWDCITEKGLAFKCVPQGSFEQRQEWLRDADEYVGQMLKVKFFELTDDDIPRFPVGIGFRLPEDT